MEENLLGYLLQADDAETLQRVEEHLAAHPEARDQLESYRQTLEPLAVDAEGDSPPPGLWIKTLARVAEFQCRTLPFAPAPQSNTSPRQRFRRADAAVAAAVVFVAVGLAFGGLSKIWHQHDVTACQNNLATIFRGLHFYSEHHNGEFPKVEAEPPKNIAGMVVPILHDAGATSPEMSITCPANGRRPLTNQSVQQLVELQEQQPAYFNRTMPGLLGCYAYTLGYYEQGLAGAQLCGLRIDSAATKEWVPLMADKPYFQESYFGPSGNSPNHGGRGQNVLFVDGRVRFLTDRGSGLGDDIYLNRKGRISAGLGCDDAVLGASWACPVPRDSE